MRRVALIATVALAAALAGGTAASAGSSSGRLSLTEAKGPAFPVVTYVMTLPSARQLTTNDVHVTENGNPVVEPTVTPASQTGKKTFGTVLVLDASYSMTGAPIAAALAAARAFAAQRNPNEQLGLVVYNRRATIQLQLTTSAQKIATALASTPAITTDTHIYEGVAQAEAMLAARDIRSGSILLLSDGQEHGKDPKTFSQVTETARKANIRIYTIGLKDSTCRPGTLKALAQGGGGEYVEAKAQDLAPLFKQLGQQLSAEYLLQYKSPALPDTPVRVQVEVNGIGTVGSQYQTPALTATTTVPRPYNSSIGSRIWNSAITMIVLALFAAGVVALLIIVLLEPRRSNLPSRMAEFVSIRGLQRDKGPPGTADAPDDQNSWWTRFEETLEIANINASPEMIIAGAFAGTALTFLLIYAITSSWWWSLFALGVPYLVREWVVRTLARRRTRFAEQLPDALQVIASALRSGHSFAGSLAVVVEGSSEPMKSEMQRVVADEQRGVPVQLSLGVVAERMASSDVEQLALVAELQREAGGNAAEVIDRVAETVRERFDLKRLVQTLTMQGRMSRWIVTGLPIAIIVLLQLANPHYLHPLLESTAGKVVFGFAAAWAALGSYAIKRIVEIEV